MPVVVRYDTAVNSAKATDFTMVLGDLVFAPGETSKTIFVPVSREATFEGLESFLVNLSVGRGAVLQFNKAVVKLANDDTGPTLSVNDESIAEGNTGTQTMTFTVTQSAVSGLDTTVNYTIANGTATAVSDYAAASGPLTIPAGTTTKTFTVTIFGNTTLEPTEISTSPCRHQSTPPSRTEQASTPSPTTTCNSRTISR